MAISFDKDLILYSSYDYIRNDELDINTEKFNKLDGIEIIDDKHPFISYIRGFVHDSIDIKIIHGWYHIESKTVKFFVGDHPSKYGDIIHLVWQNNNDDYDVSIYYTYCGDLYESNEYDIDNKKAYKKIFKNIFDLVI